MLWNIIKGEIVQDRSVHKMQDANPDIIEVLNKYRRLVWGNKFWILLILVLVSVLWFFFYSFILEKAPEYTASAVIKFDDPRLSREVSAVTDFAQSENESKLTILKTSYFLDKVIDSLKLDIVLKTEGINRFFLFKSISITSNAKHGSYKIVNDRNKLQIFYSNKKENQINSLINTIIFPSGSVVHLNFNGIILEIDALLLKQLRQIEFVYLERRYVLNQLRSKLERRIDRSKTILTIGYTDKNPDAAALITNTIANLFVKQLLEFKKYRTTSMLISFGEQLTASKQALEKSEETLRKFREQNPYLLLSDVGSSIVSELTSQQTDYDQIKENYERLASLIQQKNDVDFEKQNLIYLEILSFLAAQNISGAQIFSEQYSQLLDERNQLLNDNYSKDHPQVIEIENKIKQIQYEVNQRTTEYLNQLSLKRSQLDENISNNQRNLRRLPRRELRLAELQRDRSVKENIYSNILNKYNEALVSDAAIIPDAFVVDAAEAPIVYYGMMDKLKVLAIGPFLGLICGIGLFILFDYFNNTVKVSRDVEEKLSLPVLATLPIIGDEKELPENIILRNKFDPKLITSDYAPHFAGESFRLLRTKLVIETENQKKSFIVASLFPNEGKSLISSNLAITFAQQKVKTILIDCDLRRGVLHNSFSCIKKPGLTDALTGKNEVKMSTISDFIQKTHIPNLYLISCGTQVPNPSELLGSNRMKELVAILNEEFGTLIFDTPPIDVISDAFVLNNLIHKIILVVRYGKTNLNKLSKKIFEFPQIKDDYIGVVINASDQVLEKYRSKYSYYNY